jgi:hypothetical protein
MTMRKVLGASLWLALLLLAAVAEEQQPLQCSLTEAEINEQDPALQVLEYDVGEGAKTTLVYVEPTMDVMYNGNPPSKEKVPMKFNGFAGKFINMSTQRVTLYWYV